MNIIELNSKDEELYVPEILFAMARVATAQQQVQEMQAAFAAAYDRSDLPAIPAAPVQRESAIIIDAADRFLKKA